MNPIRLERLDGGAVALLTLDRPEKRNALDRELGVAMRAAVDELCSDPPLRAAVLTGAGDAFSAGGDLDFIAENARRTPEENRRAMLDFYRLYLSVRSLPVPTVAAVNGAAVGAGLCLALACDVRYVALSARVGLNFVRLNLHPGMGGEYLLARLVGPAAAAELLLTGRLIPGTEAARIGLCSAAFPAAEVVPRSLDLAREIAAAGPLAVRQTVRTLRAADDAALEGVLEREAACQAENYATRDLLEGVAAIRERRPPRFAGT